MIYYICIKKYNMEHIVEQIKLIRMYRGISQVVISREVGISRSCYNMFENYKTSVSLATLVRICDVLGCELNLSFKV